MENSRGLRKWYKKKRYIIPLGAFALFIIVGLTNQTPAPSTPSVSSNTQTQVKGNSITIPAYAPPLEIKNAPRVTATPELSPTPTQTIAPPTYYTNSSGNTIQSPSKTQNNSVPLGATAICRDGSYSFSQHRSGTCSHHGGVATWLN